MADLVLLTGKDEECREYLNKNFGFPDKYLNENINKKFDGVTLPSEECSVVICWVREPFTKNHENLLHELDHGANSILRNIGIVKQTDDNEEVFTYLKSYIQRKVFEKIALSKKKIAKKRIKKNVNSNTNN
jgi:hypothetical protein